MSASRESMAASSVDWAAAFISSISSCDRLGLYVCSLMFILFVVVYIDIQ